MKRRDRSRMTPAQKQWDTINNPDAPQPERTQRERQAFFYGQLVRLGFSPFGERNAADLGVAHEYRVAQAALVGLVKVLEEAAP